MRPCNCRLGPCMCDKVTHRAVGEMPKQDDTGKPWTKEQILADRHKHYPGATVPSDDHYAEIFLNRPEFRGLDDLWKRANAYPNGRA